jgi:hypothetical protein
MIAVECYADTRLVLTLGATAASVHHAKGKGQVLDILRRGRASVGVVDEDPGSTEYPEMRQYEVAEHAGSLRLWRHRTVAGRRVVVISPRLEEWLLGRSRHAGVDPSTYGLAADPRRLHDSGRYDRHPRFRLFIAELLAIDPEVQRLREWIVR